MATTRALVPPTRRRIPLGAVLLFGVLFGAFGNAHAASPEFCDQYAKIAVQQYQTAIANRLPGIVPPVWSGDVNGHKAWCLLPSVTEAEANQGTTDRQVHLDKYLKKENTPPPAQGAVTSAVMESNSDRPGGDYKNFWINRETEAFVAVKQCEQACEADPSCRAYTFVKPGVQGKDAHCYLKNSVPARVENDCCTSGVLRPATKADSCDIYARTAVLSSQHNQQSHCGYTGNVWSGDYALHYDWCMRVPESSAEQGAAERKRLLAECEKPSTTGDLAAADVCYDIDFSGGTISFYPIVRNVGQATWRSEKKGSVSTGATVGSITKTNHIDLGAYPWELQSGATSRLGATRVPFQPDAYYSFSWNLYHDDDTDRSNNELTNQQAFSGYPGKLTGMAFAASPWLLEHKACYIIDPEHFAANPYKYWPLNLYWDETDLNGIPFNPRWGWQVQRIYDNADYYPDVEDLTRFLEIRHLGSIFGVNLEEIAGKDNIGQERDFSAATNQTLFREYGSFDCGPHVNWKDIPVTFEGYLKGAGYDSDDGDINFYLFTPDGWGATRREENQGGIKVEFDSNETVDHFHTPWWSTFDWDGKSTDNRYAIVSAMWGMDCAHECDSEMHPAYAMAIRVKDTDPNDDMYAIFARNWGNEGYCSDHVFPLNLAEKDGGYLYRFLLPWRPGASSVSSTTDTKFLQRGGVGMSITPVPGKGVIVAFVLPHPSAQGRINGELHLQWTYPQGATPRPYPVIQSAAVNAARATGNVELEDALMTQRVLQLAPPDKRQKYEALVRAMAARDVQPALDTEPPAALQINVADLDVTAIPEIGVVPDTVRMKRLDDATKRLQVDPGPFLSNKNRPSTPPKISAQPGAAATGSIAGTVAQPDGLMQIPADEVKPAGTALTGNEQLQGAWKANLFGVDVEYVFTADGDAEDDPARFQWRCDALQQIAKGSIQPGNAITARWQDANGVTSASATVELDAQGKAVKITWGNGVVMTRNAN